MQQKIVVWWWVGLYDHSMRSEGEDGCAVAQDREEKVDCSLWYLTTQVKVFTGLTVPATGNVHLVWSARCDDKGVTRWRGDTTFEMMRILKLRDGCNCMAAEKTDAVKWWLCQWRAPGLSWRNGSLSGTEVGLTTVVTSRNDGLAI